MNIMTVYDAKPSIYEANGDGSYTYRWGIKEVVAPAGDESGSGDTDTESTIIKWECKEVIVWATVTISKITAAVLASLWDSDYEIKLQNDYNSAKEGVFGDVEGTEAQKYIKRYRDFLVERKAIKERVAADCTELGIA